MFKNWNERDVWIRFVENCLRSGNNLSTDQAHFIADKMVMEYNKRCKDIRDPQK